jgi:hypothetical protein
LTKREPMNWMNRICDDINPGLDFQENDNSNPSAPAYEEKQLRDTDMPPPFNLVPIAPSPVYQPKSTKAPAPAPPATRISHT